MHVPVLVKEAFVVVEVDGFAAVLVIPIIAIASSYV